MTPPARTLPVPDAPIGARVRRFVKPDVPLSVRVMRVVNIAVVIVFANPLMHFVLDVAAAVAVAIAVTSGVRSEADSIWVTVLVFVLVAAIWFGVLYLFARGKVIGLMSRLAQGPPAFGDLGGLPKQQLRTAIRAARELRFDLAPDDQAAVEAQMALVREADEKILKSKYAELIAEEEGKQLGARALLRRWKPVWERELLEYRVGDATLREAYGPPSYAVSVIPAKLVTVSQLLNAAFLIFQAALFILAFRAVTDGGSFLTVMQVGIACGFVLTMLIYLNHVKTLAYLEIAEPPQPYLEALPEELVERMRARIGTQIVPIRVSATPAYFAAIRDYFARAVGVGMGFNAVVWLAMIGVTLAAGVVAVSSERGDIVPLYGKLALAVVVIPVVIVTLHYVVSLLIQQLRHFTAIVVGGLVTALAPLGIEIVVHGSVPTGTQTIVTAAVAGVVGTLATALGGHLTERIGAGAAPAQPVAPSST